MARFAEYCSAVAIVVLLGSGCGGIAEPGEDEVVMRTDRTLYVALPLSGEGSWIRRGFTAVVRMENRSDEAVYVARCYPDTPFPIFGVVAAERGDGVDSAYDGAWACVGHDQQFELRPGESRTDALHVAGPNAYDGDQPRGMLTGRFQVVYEIQRCRGDGECEPSRRVFSNSFAVVTGSAP